MKIIKATAVGAIMVLCVGLLLERTQDDAVGPVEPIVIELPGPMEIQRQLIDLGYDIKLDGVIGDKTKAAWSTAYGNQSALKYWPKDEK